MPKPNRTRAQELLEVIAIKNKELKDEMIQMESKKTCPFWHEFSVGDTTANDCVYINGKHLCDCLEICPGNGDAWCYKQIETSVEKKEESEIMNTLKTVLDRYADLRCDSCEMCEH